jgi:glycosyltransferase involved in cell wall biosynthesis
MPRRMAIPQMPPVEDSSEAVLRFSVIIANYNYERYVEEAIRSALDLDWPSVQVIVVDDGSSDNSVAVIERFGAAITFVRQANGGQRSANNRGFSLATGDAIVFLDADDVLEPAFAREVAGVWRDGVSKVQVQMMRVDSQGAPLGSIIPHINEEPSPDQIRRWAREQTEYPSPPGSGNAYAKSFLDKIFPISEIYDSFTDSTCIAVAPFLGDVVTIKKPLVRYRIHGSNDSNLMRNEANFGREVTRALSRFRAATDACARYGITPPKRSSISRGKHLLQLRAASLRLRPADHPIKEDGRLRAMGDAIATPFRGGSESWRRRVAISGWVLLAVISPLPWARALIRYRFGQSA